MSYPELQNQRPCKYRGELHQDIVENPQSGCASCRRMVVGEKFLCCKFKKMIDTGNNSICWTCSYWDKE